METSLCVINEPQKPAEPFLGSASELWSVCCIDSSPVTSGNSGPQGAKHGVNANVSLSGVVASELVTFLTNSTLFPQHLLHSRWSLAFEENLSLTNEKNCLFNRKKPQSGPSLYRGTLLPLMGGGGEKAERERHVFSLIFQMCEPWS